MSDATCTDLTTGVPDASEVIGRAKGIIVFTNGGDPKATITPIIAKSVQDTPSEMQFTGVVAVGDDVVAHANEIVLPVVDRICGLLGVATGTIMVEMANVGVASSSDKAVSVSGLSAELPLFLAALSARLLLPVPQNVVSTGHIGSLDGDIRIVRNMPAKLRAAIDDPAISRFICPRIHADTSMETLKPSELLRIEMAMQAALPHVRIVEVNDVSDAVQAVFREEEIALAALRSSFNEPVPVGTGGTGVVDRAARYLSSDIRRRFLRAVQSQYDANDADGAHRALRLWAAAHLKRKEYPHNFGSDLLCLLSGLSPASRHTCAQDGALVPLELAKTLTCLAASREDGEDLLLLYRAASGPWSGALDETVADDAPPMPPATDVADMAVKTLVASMDPSHLARVIGLPIDSARASFRLQSVVAKSHREFTDVVVSFYIHLLRATGRASGGTAIQDAAGDAADLIEHAFAREGGYQGARAEAQAGEQGGLRHVLDRMTYQYKMERQQKHLLAVFADTLDPLDWASKVEVIKAFRKLFPYALPLDCIEAPPERFASRYQDMIRMFVQAQEPLRQRVRAM